MNKLCVSCTHNCKPTFAHPGTSQLPVPLPSVPLWHIIVRTVPFLVPKTSAAAHASSSSVGTGAEGDR